MCELLAAGQWYLFDDLHEFMTPQTQPLQLRGSGLMAAFYARRESDKNASTTKVKDKPRPAAPATAPPVQLTQKAVPSGKEKESAKEEPKRKKKPKATASSAEEEEKSTNSVSEMAAAMSRMMTEMQELRLALQKQAERIRVLEQQRSELSSMRNRLEVVVKSVHDAKQPKEKEGLHPFEVKLKNKKEQSHASPSTATGGEGASESSTKSGTQESAPLPDKSTAVASWPWKKAASDRKQHKKAAAAATHALCTTYAVGSRPLCVCGERHPLLPAGQVCYNCKQPGHPVRCCTQPAACPCGRRAHPPMPAGDKCHHCGKEGHRARCCSSPCKRCGKQHRIAPVSLQCHECGVKGHFGFCCRAAHPATAAAKPPKPPKAIELTGPAKRKKEEEEKLATAVSPQHGDKKEEGEKEEDDKEENATPREVVPEVGGGQLHGATETQDSTSADDSTQEPVASAGKAVAEDTAPTS